MDRVELERQIAKARWVIDQHRDKPHVIAKWTAELERLLLAQQDVSEDLAGWITRARIALDHVEGILIRDGYLPTPVDSRYAVSRTTTQETDMNPPLTAYSELEDDSAPGPEFLPGDHAPLEDFFEDDFDGPDFDPGAEEAWADSFEDRHYGDMVRGDY